MFFCTRFILCLLLLKLSLLTGAEFTVSSYNCGGLSNHYDYLRAAAMEKLMQERHIAEPAFMSQNEKIQKIALKIAFADDPNIKYAAQSEWDRLGYQQLFDFLTAAPTDSASINKSWNIKVENTITSYQVRPVVIHDKMVLQILLRHLDSFCTNNTEDMQQQLDEARSIMARRIFAVHMPYDIICLQEADYLDPSMFADNYSALFTDSTHSKNAIIWNYERFELVKNIGNIRGGAIALLLRDKETDKTVLVASGHISGCNPYRKEIDAKGRSDSTQGDNELLTIVSLFESLHSDMKIIAMDSNVTALHPRLHILKEAGYRVDYENFLEPTCTNPYQVLNTRIDWISLKDQTQSCAITNIPVLSIGLNSILTNISDHKPIAAKISY